MIILGSWDNLEIFILVYHIYLAIIWGRGGGGGGREEE